MITNLQSVVTERLVIEKGTREDTWMFLRGKTRTDFTGRLDAGEMGIAESNREGKER